MFNKDIDRLFQEKFKDFEEIPSKHVWRGIDKQLNVKPKTFLGYKLAGFVMLFFLAIGLWYFGSNKTTLKEQKSISNKEVNSILKDESTKFKLLDNKENNLIREVASTSKNNEPSKKEKINRNKKEGIVIANTSKNKARKRITTKTITSKIKFITSATNSIVLNKSILLKSRYANKNIANLSNEVANYVSKNKGNVQTQNTAKINVLTKPRIKTYKYIPSNTNLVLVDLSKHKINIPNGLEKYIADKKQYKKWSVGTSIAPIYYASFSKGSPIDSHIANNEQVSSNSYAYGLNVGYQLNKKWRIITGVSKRNLSYKSKDVGVVFQVFTDAANVNSERGNMAFRSVSKGNIAQDVTFIGNLKQEMKYIEIPLGLQYNIISKKLGLALNGGFSTLFLKQDEITFERDYTDFKLGKATNINDISYSLNLGFDTSIHLSKSLEYSISPSFKYHTNTFSKNDGGFKPYSLGLNTSLLYKF